MSIHLWSSFHSRIYRTRQTWALHGTSPLQMVLIRRIRHFSMQTITLAFSVPLAAHNKEIASKQGISTNINKPLRPIWSSSMHCVLLTGRWRKIFSQDGSTLRFPITWHFVWRKARHCVHKQPSNVCNSFCLQASAIPASFLPKNSMHPCLLSHHTVISKFTQKKTK